MHTLLLLLAVAGAIAGVFALLDSGWAEDAEKPKPPSASEAHLSGQACSSCHQTPAENHFSGQCVTCHSTERPFARPQLTHITFGAHVQATQACSTCHTGKPAEEIACRSCHANTCGKNAKTAADCIKCHKSGTTDEWVPEAGVPKAE